MTTYKKKLQKFAKKDTYFSQKNPQKRSVNNCSTPQDLKIGQRSQPYLLIFLIYWKDVE